MGSVFTKGQVSLKEYNSQQYQEMMSTLYKDTLDREGGIDVLKGSQSNASELNLKKIVEVQY